MYAEMDDFPAAIERRKELRLDITFFIPRMAIIARTNVESDRP